MRPDPSGSSPPLLRRALLLVAVAAAAMALSSLGPALAPAVPVPVAVGMPHGASAPAVPSSAPASVISAPYRTAASTSPTLTTAITNAPRTIYQYKNQQEQDPQDSQVNLYVNATGNAVASYANVQVAFVVETTLYDGVYDPTVDDYGVNNPCTGPCEESDAVPFFVANAGAIAQDIANNNPYSTVTYSMVDYFATLTDHDDGDGAEYHVDVGNFVPASQFGGDVVTSFQDPVLGGNWYYSDSDFSDSFLGSSEITALYGALKGSGLAWNPSDHHVIVLIGSTAPRSPGYQVNYAGTHSDWNSGLTTTCEPSYPYGGGITSPNCEEWVGTGTNNISALANSENVNIDYIDVYNGITDTASQDYTSTSYATSTVSTILSAGCNLAKATGGSWNGPPGYSCSASETGTGAGNLTCTMGSSCFQGQSGNYNNPPRTWSDNPALGWAITHISFGPASTSNISATSNGAPMFQFTPATNITIDPSNPAWTVTCLRNGVPLSGCQQTPTVTSSGNANVYGWNWPTGTMFLKDTWEATFNVVAVGAPYNVSRAVDACTAAGCSGPVGPAPGVYSEVDYKNFQSVPTVSSFPASDIYVVYPGMNVAVTPAYSRGSVGLNQLFTVSVSGGLPPYSYQWYTSLNGGAQSPGGTASSFSYTFTTPGTWLVRCLVHDSQSPTGVSGNAQVIIVPSAGSYFQLEGNITDAGTSNPIGGANVALNGTTGSTYSATNGSYAIGPILNGTYTLYVNASGYRPYSATVLVSGNTWVNVALKAQSATTYSVRGFLSNFATGSAISGAAVSISFSGVGYGSTTTNAAGYYILNGLPNATYTVSGSASGYAPASVSVTVSGVTVWQNFSLTALPPQTYYLTGTVESNTFAPISGATVILDFNTTTTGSTGIFLYTGLSNGTYYLNVTASGYYPFTHAYTIYGAGISTNPILTPLPPPPPVSYSVGGTILNINTLSPIGSATVLLESTTGGVLQSVAGGDSGDYTISGLANGSYNIVAEASGYVNASGHFTIAGVSAELNLYLAPVGVGQLTYYTAQGVVLDSVTDLPVANAEVNVTPNVGTPQQTGPDGTFSFRLLPDTYDLVVSKAGYHAYTSTVTVVDQDVDVSVLLVPSSVVLYPISGLVYDQKTDSAIPGATVWVVNSTNPPVIPTNTSSTGGFVLSATNGNYEIEARAAGFLPSFTNVSVRNNAVSGVVLYLYAISTTTSGGSPPSLLKELGSPGYAGAYLQLWVPALVAGLLFVFALHRLRAKHAKLPPPSPPEGTALTGEPFAAMPPSPPPMPPPA